MILLSVDVYSENNNGPRTEPWGTQKMSLLHSDSVEPILMVWQ